MSNDEKSPSQLIDPCIADLANWREGEAIYEEALTKLFRAAAALNHAGKR